MHTLKTQAMKAGVLSKKHRPGEVLFRNKFKAYTDV